MIARDLCDHGANGRMKWFMAVVVTTLLWLPAWSGAEEDQRSWSLEAEAGAGVVQELTEHASTYTGEGLVARWKPGSWNVFARYRRDEYAMRYYGVTQQTAQTVFQNNTFSGPLFTEVNGVERKVDEQLLVGRHVGGDRCLLFLGLRRIDLNNGFSSVDIVGPAIRGEAHFPWRRRHVILTLDGVTETTVLVRNHRADFIVPDGEKSISYYGELRREAGWSFLVESAPHAWGKLQYGYEGAVLQFKYIDRFFNGVTLRYVF